MRLALACGIACHLLVAAPVAGADPASERTRNGLQALYDFSASEGPLVKDVAGVGQPLDLRIGDLQAVRWTDAGLEITGKTMIRTEQPATRLIDAVKQSNALTIEAWVRPARLDQTGPARIVTLSRNSGERNVTLGQEGDKVEARLRTTATSTNGIPGVSSPSRALDNKLTHLVYTRSRQGQARLYVNGKQTVEQKIDGATSNWDGQLQLALANELSGDRPWLGTYRLVALYSRDLTAEEVQQNFRAGAAAPVQESAAAVNARLFETAVAPLLSRHCLECHDTPTKQGKLDLSRKTAALAGGDSGPALRPGKKAAESPLWQRVATNEMPHDRPPLSDDEKAVLRQWLDGGGAWTLDAIDPAIYAHGSGSNKVFVQRLTVPEYIETVRSTLGVDIAKEASELLPRDLRADGFSNTAYNLNVDLVHVEAYARLAEIVVSRADVRALGRRHTSSREMTDENYTKIIKPLGQRMLRGPLSTEEIQAYCGLSTTVAATGGNFDDGLGLIIEAMLQSPRFLYRIEGHRGDGHPLPLTQYELATRLSYILWGGPPDDALLQAAEKGQLDRNGVASQAQRMLQDRRAVDRSRQFLAEWLNLGRLDNLRPSPEKFPDWQAPLAADMRDETLAFFEEIVWTQQRPLVDLLNAQVTFITPRLARHYGLPMKDESPDDKPQRYDLSAIPGRGGLLTHGSILTVGGDEASTVTRGLFVMHELLRGVVRDPPPCVDTTPIRTKPGLTQRAIAETRIANQSCTGCHSKFEPLSFGLGKFDGLGTYHDRDEHGNTLRDDGNILFPGQETSVPFQTSAELMNLLAGSERVRETFTWKVTQFALGRPLVAADAPTVAAIHRAAQESGGTYPALLTAIVTSDLVLQTRTEGD
jgi:hypothetical protein